MLRTEERQIIKKRQVSQDACCFKVRGIYMKNIRSFVLVMAVAVCLTACKTQVQPPKTTDSGEKQSVTETAEPLNSEQMHKQSTVAEELPFVALGETSAESEKNTSVTTGFVTVNETKASERLQAETTAQSSSEGEAPLDTMVSSLIPVSVPEVVPITPEASSEPDTEEPVVTEAETTKNAPVELPFVPAF
jgi:hypothetical protein